MPRGRGPVTGVTTIAAIWKSAVALIVCLAAIDVIGVLACVWFDIKPFGGNSAALPYAIWFVGGIFAGVFTIGWAGSWIANEGWTDRPEAPGIAARVLVTCAAILAGLTFLFWRIYWSQGVVGDYFVPDSMSHTLTYFLSAFAALVAAPFVLKPKPARPG
jgi:hypothetical protein